MAKTVKQLREERSKLSVTIQELANKANNESRDFTAVEKENWEKVNKDYDALSAQIEIQERSAKVQAEQTAPARHGKAPGTEDRGLDEGKGGEGGSRDDDEMTEEEILGVKQQRSVKPAVFNVAMQGWMLRASGEDVEERHVQAAKLCGINLRKKYLDINVRSKPMTQAEARALSAVDLSNGAATIAPTFANKFEIALLQFGGIRNVAEVIRTDTGAELPWPTANDTSNEGEIVGENTATGTDQQPSMNVLKLGAFKYSSKIIQVPVELMQDSAFDLASQIAAWCGERIGRRQNRDATVGNAAGKMRGIITAASVGVTAASSTAFTAEELIGLVHSVDPAYRIDPTSQFMFHDQILLAIRKLKDSQGRFLFQDPKDSNGDPTVWGYRYQINQHMSSALTTAQDVAAFGQLNKYKIRDVQSIRLRRLVERYADQDQEGFVAFMRSDGGLLDAGTGPVKKLRLA